MTTLAINEHFILTFTVDANQAETTKQVLEDMRVEIDSSEAIGPKVKYHIYVHGINHAVRIQNKLDSRMILKNMPFIN